MDVMFWVWIGAIILSCLAEAVTPQLVSIWFVGGSLAALIAMFCNAQIWLQIILFIVVSGILVIITRPMVKKFLNTKTISTNADRVVGKTAIVTQTIDNINGTGLATVMGQSWTARSIDDEIIQEGQRVTIEKISGVKIIVSKIEAAETVGAK